jgi:hypothetical protein
MPHVALGRTGACLGYKWRLCSRGGGEARVSVADMGVSQEVGRALWRWASMLLGNHTSGKWCLHAREGKLSVTSR